MSNADPYEAWRQKRSDPEVDPRFADRVMATLRASGDLPGCAEVGPRGALRSAFHYAVTAALLAASAGVGVLRIESVAALVLLFSNEGF